eukprot:3869920-Rhodomonas_salina.3
MPSTQIAYGGAYCRCASYVISGTDIAYAATSTTERKRGNSRTGRGMVLRSCYAMPGTQMGCKPSLCGVRQSQPYAGIAVPSLVTRVVVTVPTMFSDAQRRSTSVYAGTASLNGCIDVIYGGIAAIFGGSAAIHACSNAVDVCDSELDAQASAGINACSASINGGDGGSITAVEAAVCLVPGRVTFVTGSHDFRDWVT